MILNLLKYNLQQRGPSAMPVEPATPLKEVTGLPRKHGEDREVGGLHPVHCDPEGLAGPHQTAGTGAASEPVDHVVALGLAYAAVPNPDRRVLHLVAGAHDLADRVAPALGFPAARSEHDDLAPALQPFKDLGDDVAALSTARLRETRLNETFPRRHIFILTSGLSCKLFDGLIEGLCVIVALRLVLRGDRQVDDLDARRGQARVALGVGDLVREERAAGAELLDVAAALVVDAAVGVRHRVAVPLREASVAVREAARGEQVELRPEALGASVVERRGGEAHTQAQARQPADVHDGDRPRVLVARGGLASGEADLAVLLLHGLPALALPVDVQLVEDEDLGAEVHHELGVVVEALGPDDDEPALARRGAVRLVLLPRHVLLAPLALGDEAPRQDVRVLLDLRPPDVAGLGWADDEDGALARQRVDERAHGLAAAARPHVHDPRTARGPGCAALLVRRRHVGDVRLELSQLHFLRDEVRPLASAAVQCFRGRGPRQNRRRAHPLLCGERDAPAVEEVLDDERRVHGRVDLDVRG